MKVIIYGIVAIMAIAMVNAQIAPIQCETTAIQESPSYFQAIQLLDSTTPQYWYNPWDGAYTPKNSLAVNGHVIFYSCPTRSEGGCGNGANRNVMEYKADTGKLRLDSLKGNGIAHICADSNGNLIRC